MRWAKLTVIVNRTARGMLAAGYNWAAFRPASVEQMVILIRSGRWYQRMKHVGNCLAVASDHVVPTVANPIVLTRSASRFCCSVNERLLSWLIVGDLIRSSTRRRKR